MLIAQIATAKGPITLGFVEVTREELERSFNALLTLLASVDDPIVATSADGYLVEAPEGTPATMTFKYLGYGEDELANDEELVATVNYHLSNGIFACVINAKRMADGRIAAEFESFELISDELKRGGGAPTH